MKAHHIIQAHSSHINKVQYSQDGTRLFSCGFSGELKEWNTDDWSLNHAYEGHSKTVNVCVEANGQLISGALDGCLNFYDLGSRELLNTHRDHKKGITRLRLSPDGKHILTSGPDRMLVLRDLGGEILGALKTDARHVGVSAVSPDSDYAIVSGLGNTLRLFSLPDLSLLKSMEVGETAIRCVIIPQQLQLAYVLDYEGTLSVLDRNSWKLIKAKKMSRTGGIGMAFAPERNELAITADKAVLLVDADSLEEKQVLSSSAKGNYGLSYSPDESQLALASADKKIRIWNLP